MGRNPFFLGFLAIWILAWAVLIADGGRSRLTTSSRRGEVFRVFRIR